MGYGRRLKTPYLLRLWMAFKNAVLAGVKDGVFVKNAVLTRIKPFSYATWHYLIHPLRLPYLLHTLSLDLPVSTFPYFSFLAIFPLHTTESSPYTTSSSDNAIIRSPVTRNHLRAAFDHQRTETEPLLVSSPEAEARSSIRFPIARFPVSISYY